MFLRFRVTFPENCNDSNLFDIKLTKYTEQNYETVTHRPKWRQRVNASTEVFLVKRKAAGSVSQIDKKT